MPCCSRCAQQSRYTRRLESLRTLGQAGAESFDVQGTLSTVQGAQQAANNVQATIQQYGDTSSQAVQNNAWQGIVAGANQIIPGAGSALDEVYQLLPHASAGPGYCVSDPPSDPTNLRAWSHYTSWETLHGSYTAPPSGSFEAFADAAILKNKELEDNCFPQLAVRWNVLLAALVAGWNATHAGPAATITRTGLQRFGGDSDPIAVAMELATLGPPAPGQFAGTGPDTVSITVNRGPKHPKLINLIPAVRASAAVAAAHPVTSSSTSSSSSSGVAVVAGGAGVAALALVAWRMHKGFRAIPRSVRGVLRP